MFSSLIDESVFLCFAISTKLVLPQRIIVSFNVHQCTESTRQGHGIVRAPLGGQILCLYLKDFE